MRTYRHLYHIVRPSPFGYYWEEKELPDWIHITIEEVGSSKVLKVHSRIHVRKEVEMHPHYSKEFSDNEILKDMSGKIFSQFIR